jgi:predicted acetyltransferase
VITIRRSNADDMVPFFETMSLQFSFDLPEDPTDLEAWKNRNLETGGIERGMLAEDDGRIVGTLGAFDLDMTVPGGSVPCAGTTWVSVAPSHRRRGVLRNMMSAHLAEAVEHGDVIAALWASDSAIYQRFGYGRAVESVSIDLNRPMARFREATPVPDQIQMISTEEAAETLPPLYERIRRDLPGAFARSEPWWRHRQLRDTPERRGGRSALRIAVSSTPDGRPTGYVIFRVERRHDADHSNDTVHIVELLGSTPASWSALWSLVLGLDLATRVKAPFRPLDDPLFEYLTGVRRVERTLTDTVWVRVLDVERALTSRTYGQAGTLTIAVDDVMGFANGTYRLAWDGHRIECSGTSGPADLDVDVSDLGAAFLGRPAFAASALAGTIGGSIEAATVADRMFGHHRPPYCPEVF